MDWLGPYLYEIRMIEWSTGGLERADIRRWSASSANTRTWHSLIGHSEPVSVVVFDTFKKHNGTAGYFDTGILGVPFRRFAGWVIGRQDHLPVISG